MRLPVFQLWSDMLFGWCLDAVLKSHMDVHRDFDVYMYMFDHRSEYEVLPKWMGKIIAVIDLLVNMCCLCLGPASTTVAIEPFQWLHHGCAMHIKMLNSASIFKGKLKTYLFKMNP